MTTSVFFCLALSGLLPKGNVYTTDTDSSSISLASDYSIDISDNTDTSSEGGTPLNQPGNPGGAAGGGGGQDPNNPNNNQGQPDPAEHAERNRRINAIAARWAALNAKLGLLSTQIVLTGDGETLTVYGETYTVTGDNYALAIPDDESWVGPDVLLIPGGFQLTDRNLQNLDSQLLVLTLSELNLPLTQFLGQVNPLAGNTIAGALTLALTGSSQLAAANLPTAQLGAAMEEMGQENVITALEESAELDGVGTAWGQFLDALTPLATASWTGDPADLENILQRLRALDQG